MSSYNQRPDIHAEMNGVGGIGLTRALMGLVAFGAYTAFFLAGFVRDLLH